MGTKKSGMLATANTWGVRVEIEMHYQERRGVNTVAVVAMPYESRSPTLVLFEGTEEELLDCIERHRAGL